MTISKDTGQHDLHMSLRMEDHLLEGDTRVKFIPTPQQQEAVRWYLEDYLEYPLDPAPRIAAQVEGYLDEIGLELFAQAFHSTEAMQAIAALVRDKWSAVRIEIVETADHMAFVPGVFMRPQRGNVGQINTATISCKV